MNCPVAGCVANNEGCSYGGQPMCMQAWAGDPESHRTALEGCCMMAPRSNKPQIDVREHVKAMTTTDRLRDALELIGAKNDMLSRAERESNINQAWHIINNILAASEASPINVNGFSADAGGTAEIVFSRAALTTHDCWSVAVARQLCRDPNASARDLKGALKGMLNLYDEWSASTTRSDEGWSRPQWQPITTAPCCIASTVDDNGKRPLFVTRWPITGAMPPVAVARLTRDGWISGKKGRPLYFEPTHWCHVYENVPPFPPPAAPSPPDRGKP